MHHLVKCYKLKFQILVRSNSGSKIFYFSYFEVIFHFRLSSSLGHLHLTTLYPLVKSFKSKIQIWLSFDQLLLWYSTFYILRSSYILGCLSLEVIFIWHLCTLGLIPTSLSFKFDYDPVIAETFYFSYFEVIFHFRSSSIGSHLHLTPLYPFVKSCKLKFQIWVRSNQWVLRYSTFHILRWSSILGRLTLEVMFIWQLSTQWLSPISLGFKFQLDLTRGCWDILLFIFWDHLPF